MTKKKKKKNQKIKFKKINEYIYFPAKILIINYKVPKHPFPNWNRNRNVYLEYSLSYTIRT